MICAICGKLISPRFPVHDCKPKKPKTLAEVKVNIDPEQQHKYDGRVNIEVYSESFEECEQILQDAFQFMLGSLTVDIRR